MKTITKRILIAFLAISIASFTKISIAQVDSAQVAKADTKAQPKEKDKKQRKRKDEIILYAGVNLNQLYTSSSELDVTSSIGYQLGATYKRGKFFYWQVGARYNNPIFHFSQTIDTAQNEDFIGVQCIDIPITGGINFLSFVNRVVALRLFLSLDPSFTLGVKNNDLGISKSDLNSFVFYGQGGIGVSVVFLTFDLGYNYGFKDFLTDYDSKPGQLYFSLGFRF